MFCDEIYPYKIVIKHNGRGILRLFLGIAKISSIFVVCLKSLIFLGVTCQARFFFFFFFFFFWGGGGGLQSRCWGPAYVAGKKSESVSPPPPPPLPPPPPPWVSRKLTTQALTNRQGLGNLVFVFMAGN